ncbi:MAG: hypothetical protein GPJ52_14285 [Candidatus Heimdallarchaeota archaeon]|nr:hypothetical protein [Candidatus Heimdallarchaeota archaeon]
MVCEKCSTELLEQQKERNLCSACLRKRHDLQLGFVSVSLAIVFFVVGLPLLIVGIIYAVVVGFDPIDYSSFITIISINYITAAFLLTFFGLFLAFGIRKLLRKSSKIISFKLSLFLFLFAGLSFLLLLVFWLTSFIFYFSDMYPLVVWGCLFLVLGIISFFIDKKNMLYY